MNRICKLALGGTQTPQPSNGLAKNDHPGTFTIFDPPGSTFTDPIALTANGTVIGNYVDANGIQHGFLRTADGAFATIDVPGAQLTWPTAINPGGVIVGWYVDTSSVCHGFQLARDGTFTTFDAPPGYQIFGSTWIYNGAPPSINPAGAIAGTYGVGGFDGRHGFVRTKDDAFTTIDMPGATDFTEVNAINPAGVMVGDFCNPSTCFHGFLRTPDGTFSDINANAGIAMAINPAGAITGFAYDGTGGYVRSPDGSFTTFNPPGSEYTSPFAINPAGAIAGYYCDAVGCRSFLRAPNGAITTFDPPGSIFSGAFGINPAGVVTGLFYDTNGAGHGFVYRP
jgi:hypothetical protein